MLPTARPHSPARVRVGWLPFAGISLPGAEALRLLVMDYEQDVFVPAPDMPSAPGGSRGPIHPSNPDVMRLQCHLRTTSRRATLRTRDRSGARRQPPAKRPRGDG